MEMTLTQRRDQQRLAVLLNSFFGTLIFVLVFAVIYHHLTVIGTKADLTTHMNRAVERSRWDYLIGLATGNNYLWHCCVWLLQRVAKIPKIYAACLVTAGSVTASYLIYVKLLDKTLEKIHRALIPAASFVLCMVGPIYLPWVFDKIYRVTGSPNVWHSPTQMIVRPFAILVFWMTVEIYTRLRRQNWQGKTFRDRRELLCYIALTVFSELAKPSFLQAMVPGLGILMIIDLIRTKGRAFQNCFRLAMAYVPSVLLMGLCFVSAFYGDRAGAGGVEIAPFVYWSRGCSNIPMSILLLYAFPLFVFIADRKKICRTVEGQLSLSLIAASGAEKALLIEKGTRRWHGNFTWAWGIVSCLVWFTALRRFLELMTGDELSEKQYRVTAAVGWTLLTMHLLVGILYYVTLMTGTAQC